MLLYIRVLMRQMYSYTCASMYEYLADAKGVVLRSSACTFKLYTPTASPVRQDVCSYARFFTVRLGVRCKN